MTNDEENMALRAIRYTMGRQSYVVSDGQRWAREWGAKSSYVRGVLIRDLLDAIERCDAGFPCLGDPRFDEPGWREVFEELKRMNKQ